MRTSPGSTVQEKLAKPKSLPELHPAKAHLTPPMGHFACHLEQTSQNRGKCPRAACDYGRQEPTLDA